MAGRIVLIAALSLAAIGLLVAGPAGAQAQDAVRTNEKVISDQINHLRSLPDDVRTRTTKQLAIDIRQLPATNKLNLAYALANYSTEGDFGHDALQEVATTLAGALREKPPPMIGNQPAQPYVELVVLAISDEEAGKINELLAEKRVSYPILLDPGRKVYELFRLDGIPKSFVYDRDGRLVSQAIDMRTQKQFLELLAKAGLH